MLVWCQHTFVLTFLSVFQTITSSSCLSSQLSTLALLTSISIRYEVKTPDNDSSQVGKIPYFLMLLLSPLIISALELLGAPSSGVLSKNYFAFLAGKLVTSWATDHFSEWNSYTIPPPPLTAPRLAGSVCGVTQRKETGCLSVRAPKSADWHSLLGTARSSEREKYISELIFKLELLKYYVDCKIIYKVRIFCKH